MKPQDWILQETLRMKVEKTWLGLMKKADFKEIGKALGIDQVTARLLRNKDLLTIEEMKDYLYPDDSKLHDPIRMKDIDKAARILKQKIEENKPIHIIGDYDVDGISATFILYKALTLLGGRVSWDIPHRIYDGYGINVQMVEKAARMGADTIVTCDNGIAAFEAIEKARELGMSIIVTDHHEVPVDEASCQRIVNAHAVVDPKQMDCHYPYKQLCGAAVAYKLMLSLYELQGADTSLLDPLLENVAMATVADVMPLTGENRILVKIGLERLQATENMGLAALMRQKNLNPSNMKAYHIGFVLGPCLNAAGRLDTAKKAIELLLSEDENRCEQLAEELIALNEERKEMTRQGTLQAVDYVEEHYDEKRMVYVIYLPMIHESIAGIIAGRIREKYNRPTFVITRAEDGLKGSGRSIDAYNMYEEICKCADVLSRFGGHAMAAGISLQEENLEIFSERINELASLSQEDIKKKYYIDVPMPFAYARKDLIEEFALLEPFGRGNDNPLFMQKDATVLSAKVLGIKQNLLKLEVKTSEDAYRARYELVAFGEKIIEFQEYITNKYDANTLELLEKGRATVVMSFVYRPQLHEYNGFESIQFEIVDFK